MARSPWWLKFAPESWIGRAHPCGRARVLLTPPLPRLSPAQHFCTRLSPVAPVYSPNVLLLPLPPTGRVLLLPRRALLPRLSPVAHPHYFYFLPPGVYSSSTVAHYSCPRHSHRVYLPRLSHVKSSTTLASASPRGVDFSSLVVHYSCPPELSQPRLQLRLQYILTHSPRSAERRCPSLLGRTTDLQRARRSRSVAALLRASSPSESFKLIVSLPRRCVHTLAGERPHEERGSPRPAATLTTLLCVQVRKLLLPPHFLRALPCDQIVIVGKIEFLQAVSVRIKVRVRVLAGASFGGLVLGLVLEFLQAHLLGVGHLFVWRACRLPSTFGRTRCSCAVDEMPGMCPPRAKNHGAVVRYTMHSKNSHTELGAYTS